MIEDGVQCPAYEDAVGEFSDYPEREGIRHLIRHLYATGNLLKVVLMLPHGIRTNPLLIDKVFARFYGGDLRQPGDPDQREEPDLVTDELAGIDLTIAGDIQYSEVEVRWCDLVQVVGTGEKLPRLLKTHRKKLPLNKMMHFHGVKPALSRDRIYFRMVDQQLEPFSVGRGVFLNVFS